MIAVLQACITGVLASIVIGLLIFRSRSSKRTRQVESDVNEDLNQSYQLFGEALSEFSKAIDAIDLAVAKPRAGRGRARESHGGRRYRYLVPASGKPSVEIEERSRNFVPEKASHGTLGERRYAVTRFSCLYHAAREQEVSIVLVSPQTRITLVNRTHRGPATASYASDFQETPADWYAAMSMLGKEKVSGHGSGLGRISIGSRTVQRHLATT